MGLSEVKEREALEDSESKVEGSSLASYSIKQAAKDNKVVKDLSPKQKFEEQLRKLDAIKKSKEQLFEERKSQSQKSG